MINHLFEFRNNRNPLFSYVWLYVYLFIIFSLFRLLFYFSTNHFLTSSAFGAIIRAFIKGLQFDAVVISFGMMPVLIFTILYYFIHNEKLFLFIIKSWLYVYFTICFFFLSASSPYFNYNFSHISIAMFNWIDTPFMMIKQVITDWKYAMYLVIFIISVCLFIWIVNRLYKSISFEKKSVQILLIFAILMFFTFIGMRGRWSAPLKESNATVSDDAYINQIPYNSVFTFVKSIQYQVSFYDNEVALQKTKQILNSQTSEISIQRKRTYDVENCFNPNIIIILMESMTICNTGLLTNSSLTPFLDSISQHSLFYTNVWSTGKHTSNGIFSTLYGYPSIWSQRSTSTSKKLSYCGLPGTLKQQGYYNIFFCTHDLSFDNLAEFLPMNHFDTAISIVNYPEKGVGGMYGVPDHIMFKNGVNVLNTISLFKPFLAVFLTASNHGPYYYPPDVPLKPRSTSIENKMIEYADWAMKYFFEQCKRQHWFDSTIFVFIADHGFIVKKENTYIPLCSHHIPLIIYSSHLIKNPQQITKLASQMDLFPTIMGLLKKNYINNTFGIDLNSENRPYVYYSEDNKLICQNDTFMYVYGKGDYEKLFHLKYPKINVLEKYPLIAKQMKEYMLVQLQTAIFLSDNKKTECNK